MVDAMCQNVDSSNLRKERALLIVGYFTLQGALVAAEKTAKPALARLAKTGRTAAIALRLCALALVVAPIVVVHGPVVEQVRRSRGGGGG